MTNQEYSRLLNVAQKVAKCNDDDYITELLHNALFRYEERTTPEKKAELQANNTKIGYIVRIICNEHVQHFRNQKHLIDVDSIDVCEEEQVYSYPTANVDLILSEIESSGKRGFYLANLFRVYIECNYTILQVANKTGINRQTLKNDIEAIKQILKTRICQEDENQKDWEM